jgi:hypothetical protein
MNERATAFHSSARVASIIALALCPHGCTRASNSEAPVLAPEPVIELSDAQKAPSLSATSLSRSDWTARRADSANGRVHHPGVVPGGWARFHGGSAYPTSGTALATDNRHTSDPMSWAIGPIEGLWQAIRAPFAALVPSLAGAETTSPATAHERMPASSGAAPGIDLDPIELE